MILEGILNAIKALLQGIISILPNLDVEIPGDIVGGFSSVIYGIGYFFPIGDVLLMLGISFTITNFHIIWKAIQRIWDALPFT